MKLSKGMVLYLIVLILSTIALLYANSHNSKTLAPTISVSDKFSPNTTNYYRFERISEQENDDHFFFVEQFEVWHDKETGQEFICAGTKGGYRTNPLSCFPTERNWK